MLLHIKDFFQFKIRKIYVICALYVLWGAGSSIAQQPAERLSLKQALGEALEHNKMLRSSKFEVAASKADEVTAGLRPNPSLSVIADIGPSGGLGPADKYYGASLGIPIELGGKRDKRLAFADASTKVSAEQYKDIVRQFTLSVQSAYIDFASSHQELSTARENLALLDSAVALSGYRVSGNDISATELARTEVERDKYILTTASLENSYHSARITLLNLLGREGEAFNIEPDTNFFDQLIRGKPQEIPSVDSLLLIAEDERPDIRALRAGEKADSANYDLQKALAAADLTISLDYSRQTGTSFYGTTLSVPLKIFDRNQGEIEKAEIRMSQARFTTESGILKLRTDIANARSDMMTKKHAVELLQCSIIQKSSSVRKAVEFAYRRGGTSLVDYLDAARTYNELRTAYYEALADYAKSILTFNSIIGKDLF